MRWSYTLVLASFAAAAPLVTQADNLSYSYVEAAYIGTDVDGRDDTFVGGGMRLSVELTDELFLFGGYSSRSADVYNYDYGEYGSLDVDTYGVGFGYAWPVSDVFDVYGQAAYVRGQADWFGSEVDENGYAVAIGVRGRPANRFEWDGAVGYTDIADEGQVSLGLAARWFFKDHVALGIQGSFGEDETSYGAGLRWDWGRSHRTHGGAHADTAVAPAAAAASSSTAPSLAQMCDMSSKVDQAECLGQIALGMSKDEVANALGRPSSTAADGSVLKYGDRYLKFDDKNRLTSITEQMPE